MTDSNQNQEVVDFNHKGGIFNLSDVVTTDDVIEDIPVRLPEKEEVLSKEDEVIEETKEKPQETPQTVSKDEDEVVDITATSNKAYFNKMVDLGIWQPLENIVIDGEEVPFEKADITDEMFAQIAKFQNDEIKEGLLKDKVETKGISDFTKKLIEIEKNGGDVNQAIHVYRTLQDPLSSIDISEEKGQVQAIKMLNTAKGLDDETVDTIIAGYKAKGILDEKAEESMVELKGKAKEYLDKINENAILAKQQHKERLKEYSKNFKDELKQYNLSDAFVNKVVAAATKEGEDKSYEVDKIYNQKRSDPKEAAELALFLLHKDEYLKIKTGEVRTKDKVETAKKFLFVKGGNTDSTEWKNRKQVEKDLIDD